MHFSRLRCPCVCLGTTGMRIYGFHFGSTLICVLLAHWMRRSSSIVWPICGAKSRMTSRLNLLMENLIAYWIYSYFLFFRNISPVESPIVSFLALGEGWHNYHHVFPWDYKTGEFGSYKLNITTAFIDFCTKIGWASGSKLWQFYLLA